MHDQPLTPELFSWEFAADPYPAYAALRRSTPFFRDERFGMIFVSRYRDILAILTDRRFSQHTPLFQFNGHQEIARRVRNVGSPPIMTYGRRAGLPADR